METNSWLYLACGAALFYLLLSPERVRRPKLLRFAWILYLVPLALRLLPELMVAVMSRGMAYDISPWWITLGDFCLPASLFLLPFLIRTERPAAS
jgi:hypothetical protein